MIIKNKRKIKLADKMFKRPEFLVIFNSEITLNLSFRFIIFLSLYNTEISFRLKNGDKRYVKIKIKIIYFLIQRGPKHKMSKEISHNNDITMNPIFQKIIHLVFLISFFLKRRCVILLFNLLYKPLSFKNWIAIFKI